MSESVADRLMDDAPALLERAQHLSLLDETATAVRGRGRGHLVLVSGEGGAGKTMLVRQFCEGRHERVLWGGCDSLFTPRPLGPFLDIAHAVGGELAEVVDAGAKPHQVVACLVRALTGQGPMIVVLEDLHWADEATLDVLQLLTRPIEALPVLVIGTYRNDELDRLHPLQLALGELRSGPTTRRLEVDPLSLSAVEQLASRSGVDGHALYVATGGNPFFVTEALAAEVGTIPATVRDAVLGRAARLDPGARTVLDAVAVAPPHMELWLLRALVEDDVDHLDSCISAGMLKAIPNGVAFRHELARRAVEDSLPPLQRTTLHRKALDALLTPPTGAPDVTRLAHHADAADDSTAVLLYAPMAALRAISLGAYREAAAQYERAVRFAADTPPDVRAQFLEQMSQAYYFTDQMDDAINALERALVCRRETDDRPGQAAAMCALSRRFWCNGDRPMAEQAGHTALALLEGLPPGRALALSYGNLSQLGMNAEDIDQVTLWGTRAIELGEKLGDAEVVAHSLNNIGTMEMLTGAGTATLERSLAVALDAGLEEHVGRAFIHLVWGITRLRSYDLAHWFDHATEMCEQRGLELWQRYVTTFRARYDLDQGRWTEASDAVAEVLRYPRSAPLCRILTLTIAGLVRARRGDPGRWEPLDEARAIAENHDDLQWLAPVALARGEAAWLDGLGPDAVVEATQHALDVAVLRNAHWVTGELLLWRRLAGVDEAAPGPVAEPFALQLSGDWAQAAAAWQERGCRYNVALALGDADDDEALRRGLEDLHQMGARRTAAIVTRRLRERGVKDLPRGPRATTQSNPANLTARELGVLQLVARGLPNAEIAERLFLSTKTVDKHVSATLRKLGARSRAEASAQAVRLGIVEPAATSAPATQD